MFSNGPYEKCSLWKAPGKWKTNLAAKASPWVWTKLGEHSKLNMTDACRLCQDHCASKRQFPYIPLQNRYCDTVSDLAKIPPRIPALAKCSNMLCWPSQQESWWGFFKGCFCRVSNQGHAKKPYSKTLIAKPSNLKLHWCKQCITFGFTKLWCCVPIATLSIGSKGL